MPRRARRRFAAYTHRTPLSLTKVQGRAWLQNQCRRILTHSTSNSPLRIALQRPAVIHIASARVQLVGIHEIDTLRGVRTSFQRILAVFAWFFHRFLPILAVFLTVFKMWRSDFNLFQCVLSCFFNLGGAGRVSKIAKSLPGHIRIRHP